MYFQTKNSYSKGYGLADSRFSFASILSLYRRGSLSYHRIIKKQGIDRSVTLPIPTYVVNRYFPRFKGSTRFNLSSFLRYAERIVRLDYDKSHHGYETLDISALAADNKIIYYSTEDIHKICVRLTNAWSRINLLYPEHYIGSLLDYLTLYYHVWSLYSATVLRLHMQNEDIPLNEKYDNLENVKCLMEHDKSRCFPVGFSLSDFNVTDPNLFKTVVLRSRNLTESFHENLYKRKVNHRIYKASQPVYEL